MMQGVDTMKGSFGNRVVAPIVTSGDSLSQRLEHVLSSEEVGHLGVAVPTRHIAPVLENIGSRNPANYFALRDGLVSGGLKTLSGYNAGYIKISDMKAN
jgi:hypothetical protein